MKPEREEDINWERRMLEERKRKREGVVIREN